jgi:hypothetical protein
MPTGIDERALEGKIFKWPYQKELQDMPENGQARSSRTRQVGWGI